MSQRQIIPFAPPGHFFEGPRWRDGRWWVADMRGSAVYSYSPEGAPRTELEIRDDRPSGLGWLPDGGFLVVSMLKQQLLCRAPNSDAFSVLADLTELSGDIDGFLNDMAVSRDGHAYIGFDPDNKKYGFESDFGMVFHIDPQGRAEIAARGLCFPNGISLTPDESTLVVVETGRPQIAGFSIGANGALGPAVSWAGLDPRVDKRPAGQPTLGVKGAMLDGCAMDVDGCIWVADINSACLRVAPGGDIVDSVFLPGAMRSWACALGGDDGKTLLLCGAEQNGQDRSRAESQLYVTRVDVAGF